MLNQLNAATTFMATTPTGKSDNVSMPSMTIFETPIPRGSRRPAPSEKALKAMKRLAAENRTPRRWLNSTDNPTVAD